MDNWKFVLKQLNLSLSFENYLVVCSVTSECAVGQMKYAKLICNQSKRPVSWSYVLITTGLQTRKFAKWFAGCSQSILDISTNLCIQWKSSTYRQITTNHSRWTVNRGKGLTSIMGQSDQKYLTSRFDGKTLTEKLPKISCSRWNCYSE